MRIRQIKPSFWEDELIDSLPDSVKLFYIGTWQLADDGGYFEWHIAEVARQLYGYQPRARRERWVRERGSVLEQAGRLVIHDCGHAHVKRLTEHQHLPGKKSIPYASAHSRDCPQVPAPDRDSPLRSGQVEGQDGSGQVGGVGGEEKKMTTIEEHDSKRNRTLTPAEEAQVWLTTWKNLNATEKNRTAAEKHLEKLGWKIQDGELVALAGEAA